MTRHSCRHDNLREYDKLQNFKIMAKKNYTLNEVKEEFGKQVREWYDNITDEQIETFLEEEFTEEVPMKENLLWFGTFIQGMFD